MVANQQIQLQPDPHQMLGSRILLVCWLHKSCMLGNRVPPHDEKSAMCFFVAGLVWNVHGSMLLLVCWLHKSCILGNRVPPHDEKSAMCFLLQDLCEMCMGVCCSWCVDCKSLAFSQPCPHHIMGNQTWVVLCSISVCCACDLVVVVVVVVELSDCSSFTLLLCTNWHVF